MDINPPLSDKERFTKINKRWKSGSFNDLLELREILLSNGGEEVVPTQEPDLQKLISRGHVIDPQEIIFDEGRKSQCHENAARLYLGDNDVDKIGVGWGLSEDGLWRQHSWAMIDTQLVETTQIRVKYYGYLISGEEAKEFARNAGILF